MPRITVCTNYADVNQPNFSGENESYDFCKSCYAKVNLVALAAADGVAKDDVEDATETDAAHPDYEDDDDRYRCCKCDRKLTSKDE